MARPELPQDLHVHTTYSRHDSSVVPEQTPELIRRIAHATTVGISDHFEHFADTAYDVYMDHLDQLGLFAGTEVDGSGSVDFAASLAFDYYIYHCRDSEAEYKGVEKLLSTGRPVIIAHPNAMGTNLDRVPREAMVEINNRYVWHCDWLAFYGPHRDRFQFVISSDAHQPQWLGQSAARMVADELDIKEKLLHRELEHWRDCRLRPDARG